MEESEIKRLTVEADLLLHKLQERQLQTESLTTAYKDVIASMDIMSETFRAERRRLKKSIDDLEKSIQEVKDKEGVDKGFYEDLSDIVLNVRALLSRDKPLHVNKLLSPIEYATTINPIDPNIGKELASLVDNMFLIVEIAYDLGVPERVQMDQKARLHWVIEGIKIKGDTVMGDKITVVNSQNVNIKSRLDNVTQIVGSSNMLAENEKKELDTYVNELSEALKEISDKESTKADLIATRLEELVDKVNVPAEKRDKSVFEITSKGLVDAANTVAEIAPKVISTAKKIATFVMTLL